MKAAAFDYIRAHTIEDVFAAFREHGDGARILAGGQSLLPMMNLRLAEPRILVDITAIPGLRTITQTESGLRIGALVRHADLLRNPLVATHAPLLAQAVPHVAHAAIRNRGTIGGSLALNDPAAEYPPVALVANATIHARGAHGPRDIPAATFFRGLYETALAPSELIEAVTFPTPPPTARHAVRELARRHGDYAIIGLALQLTLDAGKVQTLRAAFINGALRPVLAQAAATAAVGLPPAQAAEAAASALASDLDPPSDLQATAATRLHLACVLLRRTILELAA